VQQQGLSQSDKSTYRIVRNEQHAANHCDREYIRATMGSSRPVDRINHRRVDHELARKSTVSAISELCCRSQRGHVHRQGWRAGPPDDAPGWSKVCGDRTIYEASLGVAFGTGRIRGRFISISEMTYPSLLFLKHAGLPPRRPTPISTKYDLLSQ
jgi:hypothetical protein